MRLPPMDHVCDRSQRVTSPRSARLVPLRDHLLDFAPAVSRRSAPASLLARRVSPSDVRSRARGGVWIGLHLGTEPLQQDHTGDQPSYAERQREKHTRVLFADSCE